MKQVRAFMGPAAIAAVLAAVHLRSAATVPVPAVTGPLGSVSPGHQSRDYPFYAAIGDLRFNGTVIVEWNNVTGGRDRDIDWFQTNEHLVRSGYAWVGVTPQRVGVEALKVWNAKRYGTLDPATLAALYPTHADYVRAVRDITGQNLKAGYILQADAAATIAEAERADIGRR